jgi:outer membrane lipoprotein-sorting protein
MGESMTDKFWLKKWGWNLPGAAALLLLLSTHRLASAEEPSAEAVLERMAEAYRSLQSLGAELEQVKSYPQLGLTDPPERGVVYVKRKGEDKLLVRLEIQQPEQRIITVSDKGRYVLYQPRIKQAIEGQVDKKAGGSGSGTSFLSYFLGDLSGAKKDYVIVSLGDEELGERKTVHLRLTAKPEGNAYYPRIDLWVDRELWVHVRQELVEPNRSVSKLRFSGIRINEEMKDSLFTVKLPPDVERVRG